MTSYKLNKRCAKCGKLLSDINKTGFCSKHLDRTGKNNPFFGKTHPKETIEKIKKIASVNTKKLWQNEDYRNKVIKGTSKPRRESFKKEQSERIKEWYSFNPKQRELRSKSMKDEWQNGVLHFEEYISINRSKQEKEIYECFEKEFGEKNVNRKAIKYIDDLGNNKCILPDIVVFDKVVIEYNGDYWHANPLKYNEEEILKAGTAKSIREKDRKRKEILNNLGYNVVVIWQSALPRLDSIIKDLFCRLDWCNLEDLDGIEYF